MNTELDNVISKLAYADKLATRWGLGDSGVARALAEANGGALSLLRSLRDKPGVEELSDEEVERATDAFKERTQDLWDDLDDHAMYVMGYRRGYQDGAHRYSLSPQQKGAALDALRGNLAVLWQVYDDALDVRDRGEDINHEWITGLREQIDQTEAAIKLLEQ